MLSRSILAGVATVCLISGVAIGAGASRGIGDAPVIGTHVRHEEILAGRWSFPALLQAGRRLFEGDFNRLDGAGEPGSAATEPVDGAHGEGAEPDGRRLIRDGNACASCHHQPRVGGGGGNFPDFAAPASGAQAASRQGLFMEARGSGPDAGAAAPSLWNTPGMWGAGVIEMLAREMTADLHAVRGGAIAAAKRDGRRVTRALMTQGVSFGQITAGGDGTVDVSRVEGVDADLVIRPFYAQGTAVSLRQFTIDACRRHHGLEAVERYGLNTDPDHDGVRNELTVGDVTALTVFQAALAVPGRRQPADARRAAAAARGEKLFTRIGCWRCHVPAMELANRFYSEPNPYNPPGVLRPGDVARPYRFDLARAGQQPRPELTPRGTILVRAFTDLKRHDLGSGPRTGDEALSSPKGPGNAFLTKRLWGFASEPSFLHDGRATLVGDAIDFHGGEAQPERDAYRALPAADRASLVEFLKTLQVLPPGAGTLQASHAQRARRT